jgi:hypothetical protein
MARTSPVTATSPTLGNGQRVPRKKTSFLSLRKRSKDRSSTADAQSPELPSPPPPVPTITRPSSNPDTRQHRSKGRTRERRSPSSTTISPSFHGDTPKKLSMDSAVAFPSLDLVEPLHNLILPADSIHTVPSRLSHHTDSSVPRLRSSDSSIQTQMETPPQTPVDDSSSTSSLNLYPSIVAAPISGVEFMDALVDGMNGFGGDEFRSPGPSSRSRFAIPGHHPLYQPPLPTPPPGVVLGGPKARFSPSPKSSDSECEDDEDSSRLATTSRARPRGSRRPSMARTVTDSNLDLPQPVSRSSSRRTSPSRPSSQPSSSSNTASSSPRLTPPQLSVVVDVRQSTSPPPINTSNFRRPASAPTRRVVAPSISDIIRTHAPSSAHVRSRPSTSSSRPSSPRTSVYTRSLSHSTVQEEQESEPEPLDPEEEAEMLSRSSIDSITDEVQQTLRNQRDFGPRLHLNAPSFVNRQSVCSDTFSTRSPRSEFAREPSLYSSSAASIHHPSSPRDSTAFWAAAQSTQSQAIAQYLRSARLTTLLKLTRSPHASLDNPLTVSLSDLGDRSGFPVIVFLGLGCVRHIMGLYDEMAECLGIRLITIDR